MVMRQHLIHQVSIVTPSGVTLCLNVESPHVEGLQRSPPSVKTAAMTLTPPTDADFRPRDARRFRRDNPARRRRRRHGHPQGIGLPIGSPAINRTPRHTIESAVREAIGPSRGATVEIFAPEGEERAQKTYNSRLGIPAASRLSAPPVS